MKPMRIVRMTATPVTVPIEAPRRHCDGVTTATNRTILQLEADNGLVGLGEVGPRVAPGRIQALARELEGANPFALEELRTRYGKGRFYSREKAILFTGVEMACLDLQGKALGVPVSELIGGRVRDRVPVIAYVFRMEATETTPAALTSGEVARYRRSCEPTVVAVARRAAGSGRRQETWRLPNVGSAFFEVRPKKNARLC